MFIEMVIATFETFAQNYQEDSWVLSACVACWSPPGWRNVIQRRRCRCARSHLCRQMRARLHGDEPLDDLLFACVTAVQSMDDL